MPPSIHVFVHDYAGHPFQVELSRALSRRGFIVTHAYSDDTVSGKGRLTRTLEDPSDFRIEGITPRALYERYKPVGRVRFEMSYARELVRMIRRVRPDIVITCNTPLFVLRSLVPSLYRDKTAWIFWHQDIVSMAVTEELQRKVPSRRVASMLGSVVTRYEKRAVRRATYVIPISRGFAQKYAQWGVTPKGMVVVPNWAPIDEIVPLERNNSWSESKLRDGDAFRIVYSGTLGRKHNPLLLVDLLNASRRCGVRASLVVVSEGDGANILRSVSADRDDILVLPYQPIEQLSLVLSSADLAVGILEPGASNYSVPSKVLSYLAAGCPTALLAPSSNPASSVLIEAGGMVSSPDGVGVEAVARWISKLSRDPALLLATRKSARSYAEANFAIDVATDKFADVITASTTRLRDVRRPVRGASVHPRAIPGQL